MVFVVEIDFQTRIWMTYRNGFPPVKSHAFQTDSGWGCMLRSGQMLLANCMMYHELGRSSLDSLDWRIASIEQGDWIPYASVVLRFLDSPTAPYSIHNIALQGQQFGKEVGQWFGPVTISQVIKVLVHNDSNCTLGVHVSQDGMFFKNEARQEFEKKNEYGQKPSGLLILVNIRLGLDHLNPLYQPLIKVLWIH
jgi:cysteine protease ATG4